MTTADRPGSARTALRPAVATVEIVALSAAAHAGAGGALPASSDLLALVAAVAAGTFALHRQLLRLPVAFLLVASAQLAVHLDGASAAAHAGHAGMAPPADAGGSMLLSHAVGIAVTMLVLLWQDQAVLAVLAALVPMSVRALEPYSPPSVPVGGGELVRRPLFVLHGAPRRGPPSACISSTS